MFFCKSYESTTITTITTDIYKNVKSYFDANIITMGNIASYVAHGAPVMMGKEWRLKLMKDENSEMLHGHCVIHREFSVEKHFSCF